MTKYEGFTDTVRGRLSVPRMFHPRAAQLGRRTHSSRARSTPAAAADGGSNVLDTSTHAHTLLACVIRARKDRAVDVRPEHSAPISSVDAPTGSPPSSSRSSGSMPVSMVGRMIFAAGVSADGILCARAVSIWDRIVEADGTAQSRFALSSPKPGGARQGYSCLILGAIASK
jgi:hypothetical protein